MPKSDDSWSGKLRKITELEREDHTYLTAEDECYFIGEYTRGAGWKHSSTNQLITNLKKKPSKRGTFEWPHKMRAIAEAGAALSQGINQASLGSICFTPIPPSKLPGDAEYDDRITQVAQSIHRNADVRELIYLGQARDAAHENDTRRDIEALRAKLRFRMIGEVIPPVIFLVDDMLTTGCGFKACQGILRENVPTSRVIGLFISRRVIDRTFPEFNVT